MKNDSKWLLSIIFILLLGSLLLFSQQRNWFGLFQHNKDQLALAAASKAASHSVELFYTIDYRNNPEDWSDSLCAISTPQGRNFVSFFQSSFWDSFIENKVITTIEVLKASLVTASITDCEACQIWKVEITPGEIWTGIPTPNDGFQEVYLQLQNINENWLLDHVLFDEEVQALLKELENE